METENKDLVGSELDVVDVDVVGKTVEQVESEIVQGLLDRKLTDENGDVVIGEWRAILTKASDGGQGVMLALKRIRFFLRNADEKWFADFKEQISSAPKEILCLSEEQAAEFIKKTQEWVKALGGFYGEDFYRRFQAALVRVEMLKRMSDATLMLHSFTVGFSSLREELESLSRLADGRFFPLAHTAGEFYVQCGRAQEARFKARLLADDVGAVWAEAKRMYASALENFRLSLALSARQQAENPEMADGFAVCGLQQTHASALSCVGRLVSAIICQKLLDRGEKVDDWPDKGRMIDFLIAEEKEEIGQRLAAHLAEGASLGKVAFAAPFVNETHVICCLQNYGLILLYQRDFVEAKRIAMFILKQCPGLAEAEHLLSCVREFSAN